MALNTPPILIPWGNTNTTSADMVQPGAGLNNTGFLPWPVVPDREHMNWMFNYMANALRFQQRSGVTPWNASETDYIVGSWVVYNNLLYKLTLASPAGTNPATDTAHWTLGVPQQPGTLLRRTRVTATGTLASIAGCARARFRGVGGGGGGAGGRGTSNPEYFAAPGGASGSWGEFETTVIPVNWSFTMGAAGTGGAAPSVDGTTTAGTAGGAAVLSDGTNTFTCPGGLGAGSSFDGGAPGGVPTASPGGTIIRAVNGQRGGDGDQSGSAPVTPVRAGDGGSPGEFGAGGRGPARVVNAGRAGTGDGAGGSGGLGTSPGQAGGAGTAPAWILEEWS